jgi:hypothetical protein
MIKPTLPGLILGITCLFYSCEKANIDSLRYGLVSYYPFSGNAKNFAGSYHGVVNGATLSTDRFNQPNSAYAFNGVSDYILIKDFGDIVPTEEISVSMWVQATDTRTQFQMMLCPDNNRFGISAYYYHNGQNTTFWDYGWQGEGGEAPGRLYFRPEPNDTQWHHYIFLSSIKANYMKIYKDGYLLISENESLPLLNASGRDLKIGCGDGHGFHKGKIDDIRIYNRILNEREIRQLYD